MQIHCDNVARQGFGRQAPARRGATEPWFFAIDRHGRIAERFEGAFGAGALERGCAAKC